MTVFMPAMKFHVPNLNMTRTKSFCFCLAGLFPCRLGVPLQPGRIGYSLCCTDRHDSDTSGDAFDFQISPNRRTRIHWNCFIRYWCGNWLLPSSQSWNRCELSFGDGVAACSHSRLAIRIQTEYLGQCGI